MAEKMAPTAKRKLNKALFDAVQNNDVAMVRRLIAQGADPDTMNRSDCYTPLNVATEEGHLEIVRVLLEAGATPVKGIVDNLEEAITDKNVELVKLLLSYGADPDGGAPIASRVTRPLMEAARVGSMKIVEVLLAAGADKALQNEILHTASDIAKENGFPRIAAKLKLPEPKKAKGKKPLSKEDVKALKRAIQRGSVAMVRKLAAGRDLDEHFAELEATPLIYAVWQENCEVITALIDAGASPAAEGGEFPLEVAVKGNRIAVMECLVAAGADVNQESVSGTTALITAMRQERAEAVDWLLQHGADPKAKNRFGRTVCEEMAHWESRVGHPNGCRENLSKVCP